MRRLHGSEIRSISQRKLPSPRYNSGYWRYIKMARVTGLEPATSGVTGRHSNRLSYTRIS